MEQSYSLIFLFNDSEITKIVQMVLSRIVRCDKCCIALLWNFFNKVKKEVDIKVEQGKDIDSRDKKEC